MNIVELIEEMDSVLASGTSVPGLGKKVILDGDKVGELADELKSAIPPDIQEAREIIRQKDALINQAQLEAQRIKDSARQQAANVTTAAMEEQANKLDESIITQEAEKRAEQTNTIAIEKAETIIQEANNKAYGIVEDADTLAKNKREGADRYAQEILFELEERLSTLLNQVRKGIDALSLELESNIPA
tara:strand:+ start:2167 stop:2733 length:567 start_codon:yes stop_codon:yes gene_type:complete